MVETEGRLVEARGKQGEARGSKGTVPLLLQTEDADGNDTYYAYDVLNRLIEVDNALDETTAYTYDNAGNLLTQKTSGRFICLDRETRGAAFSEKPPLFR